MHKPSGPDFQHPLWCVQASHGCFAGSHSLAGMKVTFSPSEWVGNSCRVSKLLFCFCPSLISCITEHVRSWMTEKQQSSGKTGRERKGNMQTCSWLTRPSSQPFPGEYEACVEEWGVGKGKDNCQKLADLFSPPRLSSLLAFRVCKIHKYVFTHAYRHGIKAHISPRCILPPCYFR